MKPIRTAILNSFVITQRRIYHKMVSPGLIVWLLVTCLLNPVLPEVIYRVDPLALLAATLRTYQRAGCDSEQLALSCPRGTSISIELAQYGRAGDLSDHSLCPPVSQEDITTAGSASDGVVHSGTEIEVKPAETCTVSGLQYALLQTVVDACQKKRHCKFAANPQSIAGGDPCSGIRKFVEIAYKCRPYEFRSKVACENDNMPLVCNPYSRIAIYSASFGHTERESVQCGHGGSSMDNSENSGKQTCLVSYATETVMQICHGRRRCSITADAGTFGRPCKNDVKMYLKVVYTCIPRKVLKDRYETAPEADEPQQTELDMDQDELYDEDQFYKESEAIPPAPKLQGAIPNPAFPYDFGISGDNLSPSSTLMPPLLSRNDSSLEDDISASNRPSSVWHNMHNWYLIPKADNIDMYGRDTSTDVPTTAPTPTAETNDSNENATWKNYIWRRKCSIADDWGPIGLNCTESDIIMERVEVVGFIVNWMQTYAFIKQNQEEFYLYLIISVAAGVLVCLTLVIGRLTLQKRRMRRKNSNSSGSNSGKNCDAGGKFQQSTTGETQIPNSFGDDISEIDADIDLTTPMPVPSLSSRNESYLTYAPTPNCTYGSMPPHSSSSMSSATTMLMPAAHHGGLIVPGHGSHSDANCGPNRIGMGSVGIVGSSANRQQTPTPTAMYTSMGVCQPSAVGPHMLPVSGISSVSHHAPPPPSYLTGTMMISGHHHHQHPVPGTIRRTMIPTSMGLIGAPSPPPGAGPHSLSGVPSASSIYYDSTIPRNLSRGISPDSTQYFYG